MDYNVPCNINTNEDKENILKNEENYSISKLNPNNSMNDVKIKDEINNLKQVKNENSFDFPYNSKDDFNNFCKNEENTKNLYDTYDINMKNNSIYINNNNDSNNEINISNSENSNNDDKKNFQNINQYNINNIVKNTNNSTNTDDLAENINIPQEISKCSLKNIDKLSNNNIKSSEVNNVNKLPNDTNIIKINQNDSEQFMSKSPPPMNNLQEIFVNPVHTDYLMNNIQNSFTNYFQGGDQNVPNSLTYSQYNANILAENRNVCQNEMSLNENIHSNDIKSSYPYTSVNNVQQKNMNSTEIGEFENSHLKNNDKEINNSEEYENNKKIYLKETNDNSLMHPHNTFLRNIVIKKPTNMRNSIHNMNLNNVKSMTIDSYNISQINNNNIDNITNNKTNRLYKIPFFSSKYENEINEEDLKYIYSFLNNEIVKSDEFDKEIHRVKNEIINLYKNEPMQLLSLEKCLSNIKSNKNLIEVLFFILENNKLINMQYDPQYDEIKNMNYLNFEEINNMHKKLGNRDIDNKKDVNEKNCSKTLEKKNLNNEEIKSNYYNGDNNINFIDKDNMHNYFSNINEENYDNAKFINNNLPYINNNRRFHPNMKIMKNENDKNECNDKNVYNSLSNNIPTCSNENNVMYNMNPLNNTNDLNIINNINYANNNLINSFNLNYNKSDYTESVKNNFNTKNYFNSMQNLNNSDDYISLMANNNLNTTETRNEHNENKNDVISNNLNNTYECLKKSIHLEDTDKKLGSFDEKSKMYESKENIITKETDNKVYKCVSCGKMCVYVYYILKPNNIKKISYGVLDKCIWCSNCYNLSKYPNILNSSNFVKVNVPYNVSNSEWNITEIEKLIEGICKYKNNWEKISQFIETKTPYDCIYKFISMPLSNPYFDLDNIFNINNFSFNSFKQNNTLLSLLSFICNHISPFIGAYAAKKIVDLILAKQKSYMTTNENEDVDKYEVKHKIQLEEDIKPKYEIGEDIKKEECKKENNNYNGEKKKKEYKDIQNNEEYKLCNDNVNNISINNEINDNCSERLQHNNEEKNVSRNVEENSDNANKENLSFLTFNNEKDNKEKNEEKIKNTDKNEMLKNEIIKNKNAHIEKAENNVKCEEENSQENNNFSNSNYVPLNFNDSFKKNFSTYILKEKDMQEIHNTVINSSKKRAKQLADLEDHNLKNLLKELVLINTRKLKLKLKQYQYLQSYFDIQNQLMEKKRMRLNEDKGN
ncbi:conserved Plasmodium protein, unknown function [Plasmodium gallinaceum]|uniref:SANT domain-containing protein n=1 Tax=Plasmodium gallinaceum TaxID=5849 RepID=A0A1J1GMH1_PLAGA|nr:conserved Plasmodium protein, unknown function [Plasmodium gallinaceum]CRG93556.1 conserved Plasmodium protein, unknown function [Plasmodium gallinaceum]